MLSEMGKKLTQSFSEIKNKKSVVLVIQSVADDVLFRKDFTDMDYLDEQFCEARYL